MTPIQDARPYSPISEFYKRTFGSKVFKIPVALAEDCPNRMGLKGMKPCIFCDVHGSFAYPENADKILVDQIENHKGRVQLRTNAQKFLVYFQAYTTTFTQVKRLREAFEIALAQPQVVGITLGTRPDCLSHAVLDLWKEYSEKTFLAVEVGAQSFDDKQLLWMDRGHTHEQTLAGLYRIAGHCPKVNLGIHLMFGWPDETDEDVRQTALSCNELPIKNVKLHNLHVLKNTPLEDIYRRGEFEPIGFDDYRKRVGAFLAELDPEIAVHRLAALSSHWDELVAPDWTRYHMQSYQQTIDYLRDNGIYQGKNFKG